MKLDNLKFWVHIKMNFHLRCFFVLFTRPITVISKNPTRPNT